MHTEKVKDDSNNKTSDLLHINSLFNPEIYLKNNKNFIPKHFVWTNPDFSLSRNEESDIKPIENYLNLYPLITTNSLNIQTKNVSKIN